MAAALTREAHNIAGILVAGEQAREVVVLTDVDNAILGIIDIVLGLVGKNSQVGRTHHREYKG